MIKVQGTYFSSNFYIRKKLQDKCLFNMQIAKLYYTSKLFILIKWTIFYAKTWRGYQGKGRGMINRLSPATFLCLPHLVGPRFLMWVFVGFLFVCSVMGLRWDVVVCFADIDHIVENQCLNFLFNAWFYILKLLHNVYKGSSFLTTYN
jgi:hypothetical protein